jgi:hypothetical protein
LLGVAVTCTLAIPWIVALNDVLQREEREFPALLPNGSDRVIWVAVVLFGNIIGSIAYYFMVMGPHPRRPR